MEKIIKKPSELKLGETYAFHFKKKPIEEVYEFVEGIVDFVKDTKVRLVGIFQNNRIFKIVDFEKFRKVIKTDYDILLPKEIMDKTKVNMKEPFDTDVKKINKVKIKDSIKLLNKGKKIRYFYPHPNSQKNLFVDCIVKEVLNDSLNIQSFDPNDTRITKLFISKDSDAQIIFLNKNVKLPSEIKETYQHLNNDDYKVLEENKKKSSLYKEDRNLFRVQNIEVFKNEEEKKKKKTKKIKEDNRKFQLKKVQQAIEEKKKIKNKE